MASTGITPQRYARWRQSRLGAVTERLEHDLIIELARPGNSDKILDVGCGDGALAETLAAKGACVVGIDSNPEMVEAARLRDCGCFLVAEGGRLPFPDSSFDLVVAMTVLCVSGQAERLATEMARVLRPGGRLIIGELGRWNLWALWRRLRARFGNRLWQEAAFFSKTELTTLVTQAGLEPGPVRGAIYFPPAGAAAYLLSWADPMLSRLLGTFGAAFIAVCAEKS